MTRFLQLIILTTGLLFYSCGEKKTEPINIDKRVRRFISEMDSAKLMTLQHLHFVYRGPNGIWWNDSIEESRYSLQFSRKDSTLELMIHRPERFIKDFSIDLKYDTSIFNLKLVKTDEKIRVYKNWDKLVKVIYADSLGMKDPFKFISDLNDLKNKYELVEITHYTNLGNFIEFYFTTSDVLTYLPDSSDKDAQLKRIWENKNGGQWLNRNWNLRKLKKPIDIGG